MCNGIPVICTPTEGLVENCGDAAIYVGSRRDEFNSGEANVYQGTVSEWLLAIRQLDSQRYYNEKSLACRARAGSYDPQSELIALESFIMNARF